MTSRVHRGFHQVGVVLAVPVMLFSFGLASHEAWLQWTTSRLPDKTLRWQDGSASVVRSFNYHPADLTLAGIVLALSLAVYATARAVGWVLAGFIHQDGMR